MNRLGIKRLRDSCISASRNSFPNGPRHSVCSAWRTQPLGLSPSASREPQRQLSGPLGTSTDRVCRSSHRRQAWPAISRSGPDTPRARSRRLSGDRWPEHIGDSVRVAGGTPAESLGSRSRSPTRTASSCAQPRGVRAAVRAYVSPDRVRRDDGEACGPTESEQPTVEPADPREPRGR